MEIYSLDFHFLPTDIVSIPSLSLLGYSTQGGFVLLCLNSSSFPLRKLGNFGLSKLPFLWWGTSVFKMKSYILEGYISFLTELCLSCCLYMSYVWYDAFCLSTSIMEILPVKGLRIHLVYFCAKTFQSFNLFI